MKNRLYTLILLAILFTSCINNNQTEALGYPISEEGYPITYESNDKPIGYPIKTEESLILPGPVFMINTPVKEGDMVVTGTGPSEVPIILVDVTEVGTILGDTIIDENGIFEFSLTSPLQSGHSIGLQLGNLSNTDLDEKDFLYSETYFERPFIGILFDIANIQ